MRYQIPLEFSFHIKAPTRCAIGLSHCGPSRISRGRIRMLPGTARNAPLSYPCFQTVLCLGACGDGLPFFFFFFSSCGSDTESIAEKDSLFPVVGEETDGAHTQSKNMLTQSLSICLSARVSATGHDCHNAQVCSFNHSRLPRSRCGQHSSRDFSESVCSLVFLSHTFKKQHRGIVKYGVVSPRPCYQRADPYDGSLLDLADVCALCFPNFPEQLPNAAMRCFKLRRTNPFKAVMKKKTPSAEVCGSAPDVSR